MKVLDGSLGQWGAKDRPVTPVSAPESLSDLMLRARRRLLQMHHEAKVGHIGGNLSCLDALMVLYHQLLKSDDAFVLSKGHAAGALYITLWTRGFLSELDLATFHCDGTLLAGHPIAGWSSQIPFSTGSLGHGVPLAAGLALGRELQSHPGHVYCLTSDGEWQEGSNWEALIFAAHHRLSRLTVLVDENGLQGFGSTADVASMGSIGDRVRNFGVDVISVDGHKPDDIQAALRHPPVGRPRMVILRTTKGKGVPFMEDQMAWHYLPMTEEQYQTALAAVARP